MKMLFCLCALAMAAFTIPASAHSRHRHHHAHHIVTKHKMVRRRFHHIHHMHAFQRPAGGFVQAAGSSDVVKAAMPYLGSRNPTHFHGPWCGAQMALVARKAHIRIPANPNLAMNWRNAGPRLRAPKVGAVGVMRRRGGGHVGVIVAVFRSFVEMISGNSSHGRVALVKYPIWRFAAFVQPVRG